MDSSPLVNVNAWTIVGDRAEIDPPVEVHRRAVVPGLRRAEREDVLQRLDDLAVVAGVEMPHVVAIDQIDRAVLPGADQQVRMCTGLIRQQHQPAGAEVDVARVERALVVRREVVEHVPGGVDLDVAVAEIRPPVSALNVPSPVTKYMLPAASAATPDAAHPDAGPLAVRRGAVSQRLLQRRGVVAQHPAVVRLHVAMAGERDVDDAVVQQQRRALILAQRQRTADCPPGSPRRFRARWPG